MGSSREQLHGDCSFVDLAAGKHRFRSFVESFYCFARVAVHLHYHFLSLSITFTNCGSFSISIWYTARLNTRCFLSEMIVT